MTIIDRYMLRSLLVPLTYCLVAFSMLFIILDLFDHLAKILESQIPIYLVALYYLALILPTLEFLAPASMMLGTLYALWHLTRNHELTALQASGISLHRILLPFLAVGLTFSVSLAIIKETVGTQAFVWTTRIRDNRFRLADESPPGELVYFDTKTRRLWLIDAFDDDTPTELVGVKITQERADGTRIHDLLAARAEFLDGSWWFEGLRAQQYDEADNPIGGIAPLTLSSNDLRELPELTEAPESLALERRNWLFLSTLDMIRYVREHPDLSREALRQKRFDIHSRVAMPWACLVVTLFGIPAGAKTGRQSPMNGVFMAVGFFFAYYALSQVGLLIGKSGTVTPWLGAWLSNLVFLVSGIAMLLRMR